MNKHIITIGIAVLSLVLCFTLLWPKYQGLQLLRKGIEEKNIELQSKQGYFIQVEEIFEKLEDYEDSLVKISSALPETPSLPSLFNFLQISASHTGMLLEEIILGGVTETSEEETNIRETRVTLNVLGNYSSLKDFLKTLEASSRMIEVENVSFQSTEELADYFSFKIQIKTYSY